MMRLPRRIRASSLGFNMTPMIDVVFQLIIFFLVSSHLAKQESQLQLPLPTANSGSKQIEDNLPRLTINVLADGTLLMLGHRVPGEELAVRLRDKLIDAGPDLQVRIRSDREAPYRLVEPVMLAWPGPGSGMSRSPCIHRRMCADASTIAVCGPRELLGCPDDADDRRRVSADHFLRLDLQLSDD